MRGTIDKSKNPIPHDKLKEIEGKVLPKSFEILKVIVYGKTVKMNMKELLEISNCENKAEIIEAMNQSSSNFFYFGRVKNRLKQELAKEKEEFKIWMSQRMSKFNDEESEKARERKVIEIHTDEYRQRNDRIRTLERYYDDAEIAYDSLDKFSELIRSIGSMVRGDEEKNRRGGIHFKPEE